MTKTIEDIEERFSQIRFSGDCSEYRRFVQEVLHVSSEDRRANQELYYDLLEHVVLALFLENCDGTLSEAEKADIFSLIREDWCDDAADGIRASMLALLGMIQPLTGVAEWLIPVANRQKDPAYADALRGCAACPRTKPAV